MVPPRWRDAQGRRLPTIPCPRCGRAVPWARQPRYRVDQLAHYGWQVCDVARIVQWCGHPLEFVTWPVGGGWCRLLPVLGDAA